MKYALFSQVALAEDLPNYGLKKGMVATVVEHYSASEGSIEDGYSLEGFDVPHVTVEVPESMLMPLAQEIDVQEVDMQEVKDELEVVLPPKT